MIRLAIGEIDPVGDLSRAEGREAVEASALDAALDPLTMPN
jgi:hypothetical protein